MLKLVKTIILSEVLKFLVWVAWRTYVQSKVGDGTMDMYQSVDGLSITTREIHLGDLKASCPDCGCLSNIIRIGFGLQDVDDEEEEIELRGIGLVMYPCGSLFLGDGCMVDKVALILNAEEAGTLTPEMFIGLTTCEEHGVIAEE